MNDDIIMSIYIYLQLADYNFVFWGGRRMGIPKWVGVVTTAGGGMVIEVIDIVRGVIKEGI